MGCGLSKKRAHSDPPPPPDNQDEHKLINRDNDNPVDSRRTIDLHTPIIEPVSHEYQAHTNLVDDDEYTDDESGDEYIIAD